MAQINTIAVSGQSYDITEAPVVNSLPRMAIVKAAAGGTVEFSVADSISGDGATFKWQYRTPTKTTWGNASATGNTSDTISISTSVNRNGYQYRCVITAGGVEYVSTVSQIVVY